MRDSIPNDAVPLDDEIDQVFGRANPNPGRIGCPPGAVLAELARKQRPIGDPAYLHLTQCSNCYVEVRGLQASLASAARISGAQARQLVAAAAIVVALIAGGVWFVAVSPERQPMQSGTSVVPATVAVDLRGHGIERGGPEASPPSSALLPRGPLSVTLLLPTASEPGAYELEVVDAERQVRASATGTATLVDFTTTLQVDVDLSTLEPGRYDIRLRHEGEDWRFYPATLR